MQQNATIARKRHATPAADRLESELRPAVARAELPRRLPGWKTLAFVGLACAIALLTLVSAAGQKEYSPTQLPTMNARAAAPFEHCVAAPGLVEAKTGLRSLSFGLAGKLKSVLAEEGQAVKAGQLLAELENADLLARAESARADLGVAMANLQITARNLDAAIVRARRDVDRLKADVEMLESGPRKESIDAARADVAAADADARRTADDAAKYHDQSGQYLSWSRQIYDQARRQSESAGAKLEAARARLNELEAGARKEEIEKARAILASAEAELARLETTRPFQLDAARAQVAQATALVNTADADLAKTRLLSPIDGIVVWKFLHAGEAIDAIQHQPVIAVADVTQLRVRASVDEADYPRIKKGQRVKISADAFGDQYFDGKVELVGSSAGQKPFSTGEAKERLDVRVIEALVTFDAAAPLKLGLRVTAYFELHRR